MYRSYIHVQSRCGRGMTVAHLTRRALAKRRRGGRGLGCQRTRPRPNAWRRRRCVRRTEWGLRDVRGERGGGYD